MNTKRIIPGRRVSGFTLIEMMVVIAILAILATLVVGVGSYVRTKQLKDSTRNTLQIIQLSINTYREVKGSYPAPTPANTPTDTPGNRQLRSRHLLVDFLKTVPKAAQALANLPKESMENGFLDAFGNPIDYNPTGGAGGTPVLISPGPDGDFDTADDIRSDNN